MKYTKLISTMLHTRFYRQLLGNITCITGLIAGLTIPAVSLANPGNGSFPVFPPMQAPQTYRPNYAGGQFPPFQQQNPAYNPYLYQPYSSQWMQQRPAYNYYPYQQPRQMNYSTPNYKFSNMTPFGNSFSPTSLFSNNFPTPWSNANNWNPWNNGNGSQMPFFPSQNSSNKKKAWGDVRNIWPDFYTDFTEEFWDQSTNAPYDMGRMPGGWRAPSLSSPDPVTVGDAVLNQFPPMMEEMGNMMNFSN